MDKALTIGVVAKKVGVSVETIRFYQRQGLITEPKRPNTGFRQYPPETIVRLQFILRAKKLGFTLAEIGTLLKLNSSDCTSTRALTQQKLNAVRSKITDLQAIEGVLDEFVRTCKSSQPTDSCPILAALSEK